MTDQQTHKDAIADHAAKLNVSGAIPMTVDEILSGETQAGVPRPSFLKEHEDDGSVQRVTP